MRRNIRWLWVCSLGFIAVGGLGLPAQAGPITFISPTQKSIKKLPALTGAFEHLLEGVLEEAVAHVPSAHDLGKSESSKSGGGQSNTGFLHLAEGLLSDIIQSDYNALNASNNAGGVGSLSHDHANAGATSGSGGNNRHGRSVANDRTPSNLGSPNNPTATPLEAPEPATVTLLAVSLASLLVYPRRRITGR